MSEPDQDLGMYGEFTERRARGEDTKQALRIKIAESLGWKKDYPTLDDYDREILSWRNPMGRGPLNEAYIPNYDTDANAALQLVEVLKKEGWSAHLDNMNDSLWECDFMRNREFYSASAPALPEAICLAYAKVKGIEV